MLDTVVFLERSLQAALQALGTGRDATSTRTLAAVRQLLECRLLGKAAARNRASLNDLSSDAAYWPFYGAAIIKSDASMAWLLARGVSLTVANASEGQTLAHVLVVSVAAAAASIASAMDCAALLLQNRVCLRRGTTRGARP
jgi:hypothetical protein